MPHGGINLADVLTAAGFQTVAFTGGGSLSARFGFDQGFASYHEGKGGLALRLPKVEKWLRARREERFFLFLHTYDVHSPYDPPPPYDTLFFPEYRGPFQEGISSRKLRAIRGDSPHGDTFSGVLTEDDRRRFVALYDGGIRYADAQLARFFSLLRELDLWDSTLLVIFADHGDTTAE